MKTSFQVQYPSLEMLIEYMVGEDVHPVVQRDAHARVRSKLLELPTTYIVNLEKELKDKIEKWSVAQNSADDHQLIELDDFFEEIIHPETDSDFSKDLLDIPQLIRSSYYPQP